MQNRIKNRKLCYMKRNVGRPEWEERWQKSWEKAGLYRTPSNPRAANKRYVLDMFPYPSAQGLHVGHPEGYTASDILARYFRHKGTDVLHPMGFDAFGLPAENYAIKTGTHPAVTTKKNIDNMRRQIKSLGFSYDWKREVVTTDPDYYRWTQWIFVKLFQAGLAYEAEAPINWCPKDKTGLANEEVVNGKCERCGTEVTKKKIKQWLVKITDHRYVDRLLLGLDKLDWPENIKEMQRNWIGKSEGANVDFTITAYPKVFVATTNPSKVARFKKLLATLPYAPTLTTPEEERLSIVEVREGSDLRKNAEAKARAYSRKTTLPTLGVDTGFFIDGENQDPAMVRRSALKGKDETKLSRSEISQLILTYYIGIAKKRGGKVPAYWMDYFALVLPDGRVHRAEARRDVLLTDVVKGKVDEHFPMRSLYINLATKKRPSDETEQEELHVELKPVKDALARLFYRQVTVFTTRPDTLFGATYLVLSPEHKLISEIVSVEKKKEVESYQIATVKKSDLDRTDLAKEKTGVFTGAYAVNPVNNKKIPIWIADYVLNTYGTGAIMAVPAHDERDHAFAKKFSLPIVQVVEPPKVMPRQPLDSFGSPGAFGHLGGDIESECWTGDGTMVNSGKFDGMDSVSCRKNITAGLEQSGKGKRSVQYKLRDWLFSRQRYWGEPIPIIHCEHCKKEIENDAHTLHFYNQQAWNKIMSGKKTVETRALNPEEPEKYFGAIKHGAFLKLENKVTGETAFFFVRSAKIFSSLDAFLKNKKLTSQMAFSREYKTGKELEAGYRFTPDYVDRIKKNGLIAWEIMRVYPGVIAVDENDLPLRLPNVKKYEPTGTGESPLASIAKWANVTCPHCGKKAKRETNTMPQWAGSNWYFLRYLDPHNKAKLADPKKIKQWMPVDLYIGGAEHAVLHLLYARFIYKFLYDIQVVPRECGDEPFVSLKNQGLILGEDGQKMSKSRGNVVNPDEVINEFGADVMRMYEMFMGPFADPKPWSTKGMIGVKRALDKVTRAYERVKDIPIGSNGERLMHTYIKIITEDIESFKFNTCVSGLMEFMNANAEADIPRKIFETYLVLLSPFAPHITEELWHKLGHKKSIHVEPWPEYDETKLQADNFTLVVMINGKKRDDIEVPKSASQEDIRSLVFKRPQVKKWTDGKTVVKELYVKEKIYTIVVH